MVPAQIAAEIAGIRATLDREIDGLRNKLDQLREEATRWEKTLDKLRRSQIRELVTRHELLQHDIYAFPELIYHRIAHHESAGGSGQNTTSTEGQGLPVHDDPPPGLANDDDEFFIYGSRLSFINRPLKCDTTLEGLAYGLKNGMQFRLSMISPLFDPRDTERARNDRKASTETLRGLRLLKQKAIRERWPGRLLVSATPLPTEESFSSVRIACDRRISVLAATPHDDTYEWVFDQWPDHPGRSLARDLRDIYHRRYEEETFPIFMINWRKLAPENLSVRLMVFIGPSYILPGDRKDLPWASWEFPWEEAALPDAIVTQRIKDKAGAPPCLKEKEIVDIVYAGRMEEDGRTHLIFFARAHPLGNELLTKYEDIEASLPDVIKSASERYRGRG